MYVLIELYHRHKMSQVVVSLVGVCETFNDFDEALNHEVEKRRQSDGQRGGWALYPNRGWVMNEFHDSWEWMSFTTEGSIPLRFTVFASEFGFGEEE